MHATYLYDLGTAIPYSKHFCHTYYLIRLHNLPDFFNREKKSLQLAPDVLGKKMREKMRNPSYNSLNSIKEWEKMLPYLLRIAEYLDRSHYG
jgi:exopolyphosphatase/pppGpp-phosphohydrolase